jgi:hypothetical protein
VVVHCAPTGGVWQSACRDGSGRLKFATRPKEAPILHFYGPLSLEPDEEYTFKRDGATEFYVQLGSPGKGAGTFTYMSYREVPKEVHPIAEITFPARSGAKSITRKVVLEHRC